MKNKSYLCLSLLGLLCFSINIHAKVRKQFSVNAHGNGERILCSDREIILEFPYEIDPDSLDGNIELCTDDTSLNHAFSLEIYPGNSGGKSVWLRLHDGFSFSESSKYYIELKKGLRYVSHISQNGKKLYKNNSKIRKFYFVTSSNSPLNLENSTLSNSKNIIRNKLIIVSDIHIGGPRATANGYNWFADNVNVFISFLDDVLKSKQVKELIIAGDLFDEWVIPVDMKPFVDNVSSNSDFFKSIADSPTMKPVIDKLNEIADSGLIKLVYIPGNHDMLMNKSTMKAIFPNAVWKGTNNADGTITGTGFYSPAEGIIIEHGHRYDFYNAPDTLTKSHSLLPPGYFVARMFATSMITPNQTSLSAMHSWGNKFFYASWELVLWKIFGSIEPNIPPIITGINGYSKDYTYKQARDNYYDANIAGNWKYRQQLNGVYSPESVISALLTGSGVFIWGNLELAACKQYFIPERANIVVFGHTHMDMLQGYNKYNNIIVSNPEFKLSRKRLGSVRKIYANSGTWVNKSLVKNGYHNRTYVVINTSSNSAVLPTVSLYQYNMNPDPDNPVDYSILLDEKNIHTDSISKSRILPLIR